MKNSMMGVEFSDNYEHPVVEYINELLTSERRRIKMMAITVRKKRGPKTNKTKVVNEKAVLKKRGPENNTIEIEVVGLDSLPETPKEPESKMSAEEFDKILQERITQMQLILGNKSKEYAQDGDRLFNFRLAASINDTTMSVALWGMATKHLVSVMDLVMGRLPISNAMVNEKIGDLINYLVLLEAILKERSKMNWRLNDYRNSNRDVPK